MFLSGNQPLNKKNKNILLKIVRKPKIEPRIIGIALLVLHKENGRFWKK